MTPIALEIDDLEVHYGSSLVLALEPLAVAGPCLVVLRGPNGSGKSTFLKVLAGLLEPSLGEIRIGGHPTESIEAQRQVTYIPDRAVLFEDLTVRDTMNYVIGDESDLGGAVWQTAQRFGSEHLLDRFPTQLSLGQRRIASLLVGLSSRTPVLALDEPTLALDENRRSTLVRYLQDEAARRLVIVSSHEPELVAVADQLIDLESPGSDER